MPTSGLLSQPHPDPHAKTIPQGILENAIKVVNMPPTTLKANMRRAFAKFSQETLDECKQALDIRPMIFGLCFFHACVVARHKFGSQGWSRSYGFNFGDLTISAAIIVNYLNNNEVVPWNDVRYIIGEVMYGGHITDKWDRRVAVGYLANCLQPGLEQLSPEFDMPLSSSDYETMLQHIESKVRTSALLSYTSRSLASRTALYRAC
jgi:dynein heavy chain, axonemal